MIFNENIGKVVEQYCKKGSKVYVEGQLQTRKWTDQAGAEKYTTEVVLQRFRGELTLLDSRGGGEGRDSRSERRRTRRQLRPLFPGRQAPGADERRRRRGRRPRRRHSVLSGDGRGPPTAGRAGRASASARLDEGATIAL